MWARGLHDRLDHENWLQEVKRHNLIPIQGNTDIAQTSRKNRFSFSRSFCACQLLRVIEFVKVFGKGVYFRRGLTFSKYNSDEKNYYC